MHAGIQSTDLLYVTDMRGRQSLTTSTNRADCRLQSTPSRFTMTEWRHAWHFRSIQCCPMPASLLDRVHGDSGNTRTRLV